MHKLSVTAPLVAFLTVTSPAVEAQMAMGDPQLASMLEQMINYVYMGCQMGNQQACASIQPMQVEAQNLLQAGQYCMQTNDPNACGYYQNGVMQAQMAYAQMGSQMQPAPAYDPNNPLGPTHQDRLNAIQAWGGQMTQDFDNRINRIDQNQAQFLEYIRQ
ncbi:MAG: hypothetical protein IT542_00250 [Rubellimicrobium sp.]|nr:hypothetical protein [Rubellimicrobium sp.]